MARTIFLPLYRLLIAPRSSHEDVRRREFILSILLLGFVVLLGVSFFIEIGTQLASSSIANANDGIGVAVVGLIFIFFFGLYISVRRGYVTGPGYVLVSLIFGLASYLGYRWGVDLPTSIVFYPLAIIIAGIVIDTRVAFLVTVLSGVSMTLIGYAQEIGVLDANNYWRTEKWELTDTLMIVVIFAIIALVSWLSNREIERSLLRARRSEAELIEERDQLEVRVKERTEELRETQLEKMSQAYRFVEFGRIASGLFHDLANPLAALSLNIDAIEQSQGTTDPEKLTMLTEDVGRARSAAAHMQRLMDSMRRYLAHEGLEESFSVATLLREVVTVLSSYAKQQSVLLTFEASQDAPLRGDPVAFTQVLTNLISNAIESFSPDTDPSHARTVHVALIVEDAAVHLSVRDSGRGIPQDILESIFEPFVTTKGTTGGLGIGLPLAKRIIEREFEGTLSVESTVGEGAVFAIYFPIREP